MKKESGKVKKRRRESRIQRERERGKKEDDRKYETR